MSRAQDIFDRVVANGISAVEAFVVDRQAEELFLDFKRSSNDGNDKRLSSPDRKNLAKAISGFGNSEGGVIVWGVDCSTDYDGADVAKALYR
ncbi:MAG: ATP-binding protein [Rhodocyclaceae bacterium]|nr:ATP-binding protein [Rhodocyclaceae bacterium]